MVIYRIALKKYIHDLSGKGAKEAGGRWNHKGAAVVYTSERLSLATVEILVHLPLFLTSRNLMLATIHVPDSIVPHAVAIADLPKNWRYDPPPPSLAKIGNQWVSAGKYLLLRVPSAVVDKECNILINPEHPDMKHLSIVNVERFKMDERLLRERTVK
jgi:RES domain-containing protein